MEVVDVRCPVGPRSLLMRLRLTEDHPFVNDDNLLELACDSCKSTLRKSGKNVKRVLHLYDFTGALSHTRIE